MSIRVRFAPSPTGPLHIGGVRTALYNYLFAKKRGGKFLLRIEDTDQKRYVQGAEQYIMDALRWCGLEWDEGPDKGGPFAPYRQSERKELYLKHAMRLIDNGRAYYAFDTTEELENMRKMLEQEHKGNPQYDCHSRMQMNNSLTMSEEEVQKKISAGVPYVIRINIPTGEEVLVNDLIRGEVRVNSDLLDDKVLFKSDGLPTYHLANIVDDHQMQITHVIRGEEWLPSAPLHVLLYRYLGWESDMPQFAHLPLLLKPDGKGKLSKRDGDRMGFPVFPLEWKDPESGELSMGYRESGYFPEAFINLLAMLGWNPGTEQELFDIDELIEAFSLERVGKAGARFDPEKAKWFNHQYMQTKPLEDLEKDFCIILNQKGIQTDPEKVRQIIALVRERVNFVHELWEQAAFFFSEPKEYDPKFVKKKWKEDTSELMTKIAAGLRELPSFDYSQIESFLHSFMEKHEVGAGKIMPGLRLALVGAGSGPDVKAIMEILGRDEVVKRIEKAANELS